jgi:hypothetical protein
LAAKAEGSDRGLGARIFDVRAAEHYSALGVARLWARAADRGSYRPGWEFRLVDELRWEPQPAVVEGSWGASLRVVPGLLAGSLGQSGGLAGLRLGPVEMKTGVNLSLFNLVLRQGTPDFGMFWPRALVALGLNVGGVRVEAVAHVEYLWCWSGPSEYARGLGLMLSLERPSIALGIQKDALRESRESASLHPR